MTRFDEAIHDVISGGPPPPDLDVLRRRARRRQRALATSASGLATIVIIAVVVVAVGRSHTHESVTVAPSTKKVVYGTLPPRTGAAIAYDQARRQVVLFGGDLSRTLADTWLWDGHGWSEARPAVAPPARENATMAYDPAHKDVVLFGGTAQPNQHTDVALNDTWTWNGTTWTERHPLHEPPWSSGLAMSYDPRSHSILLLTLPSHHPNIDLTPDSVNLHGVVAFGTWRWDGSDWHELPTPAAPLFATADAAFHTNPRLTTLPHGAGLLFYSWAVYTGSCLLTVSCGRPDPNGTISSQTWTWNGTGWTKQHPHRAPVAGQLVATPGTNAVPTVFTPDGTTWRWTGSDWDKTKPLGPGPLDSDGFAVYDEADNTIVAYAGQLGVSDDKLFGFYDTWTWDGTWTHRFRSNTPVTTTVPPTTTTSSTLPSSGVCKSTQLQLSLARDLGATMSQAAAFFALTNTSTKACTMDGYPALTLYDASSHVIPAAIRDANSYQINDPGPHPVTTQPGQRVYFGFGWLHTNPDGATNGCKYVFEVRVGPPNDNQRLNAAAHLQFPVCPQSGGSVTAVAASAAFTIVPP